MASNTVELLRGTALTISDGDTPANTLEVILGNGSLTMTDGGHNYVWARDTSGDLKPTARKGDQAGPSTGAITAQVYQGVGDAADAATMQLVDVVNNSAQLVADWVSKTSNCDGLMFLDLEFSIPDCAGAGTKGGTFKIENALIDPGASITPSNDGTEVSFTFSSAQPKWTFTPNP